jgi:hypothetical protein
LNVLFNYPGSMRLTGFQVCHGRVGLTLGTSLSTALPRKANDRAEFDPAFPERLPTGETVPLAVLVAAQAR